MGSQATVTILTDRLAEIERDPDFGRKLVSAIRAISRGVEPHVYVNGQIQVICVMDGDTTALVRTGGDTGRVFVKAPLSIPDESLLGFAIETLSDEKFRRLNGDPKDSS